MVQRVPGVRQGSGEMVGVDRKDMTGRGAGELLKPGQDAMFMSEERRPVGEEVTWAKAPRLPPGTFLPCQ